jgi:hypothetical protein
VVQGLARLAGLRVLELHGMRCLEDLSALRALPQLLEFSGWFESLDLRHLPASLTKLVVMGVIGVVAGMPGLAPGQQGPAGQQLAAGAQQQQQQQQQPEGQQAAGQPAQPEGQATQAAGQQQAQQQQPEGQQAAGQAAQPEGQAAQPEGQAAQAAGQQQAQQQQQAHAYPALQHLTLVFEEVGHWDLEVLLQRNQFLSLLGAMLASLRHLGMLTHLPYHLRAMPAALAPPSNGEVLSGLSALQSLQVPEPWDDMPAHLAPLQRLTSLSFAQFELPEAALRSVVEGVTALGALRELVVHPKGSWPPALAARLRQALPCCRMQAPQLGMQGEL